MIAARSREMSVRVIHQDGRKEREVFSHKKTRHKAGFLNSGALGRIRTSDRLVRSQVLYPAELRVRKTCPARPDEGRVL